MLTDKEKQEHKEQFELVKKTRSEKIFGMWMDGYELESIGREFDVTRERIRQILTKHGITEEHKSAREPLARKIRKESRARAKERWLQYLEDNPEKKAYYNRKRCYTKRGGPRYINWRRAVLTRDEYRCVACGSPEKLAVHHIKCWILHAKLRFKVDNGATLCDYCHRQTHNFGGGALKDF